jgi:3-deoxy-D-manno-octulosonic-acid transferase
MRIRRAIYDTLLPLFGAAMRVAGLFNKKIASGVRGRRRYKQTWRASAAELNRNIPLLWFHVSSVGEFLQAQPVIELLHERMGQGVQIALTFFSPSGMDYITKHDRSRRNPAIRFIEYLPLDTRSNERFCIETLKPDMIIYVKFDLWPNLILEASDQGIPQILISGTLAPNSKRLLMAARGFYGSLYSKLTAIAAISDEDNGRFKNFARGGVEIVTAGDTRFDQVCQRIDTSTVTLPQALSADERLLLIAGSTWPKDEEVVIPGFNRLIQRLSGTALIIVPHEPTRDRLEEISRALKREGLSFRLLSELTGEDTVQESVIIADGVGYLAELYRVGAAAYVGGSFTTGVHNVMEPAVLGLPVLFGPRIQNSFEARKLVDLGVGTIVRSALEFESEAGTLLSNRDIMHARGQKGMKFIRNHCGAALNCVDLIEKHLKRKGRP